MQSVGSPGSRNCVSCGRSIARDANVCPYCGHDFRIQMAPQAKGENISGVMKLYLYLVSLFVPIVGFVIGFVYYSRNDPEFKHVGTMCVLLALIPLLVVIVVLAAILMGILVLGWALPWDVIPALLPAAA